MRICVVGEKGGTGKSTIATGLSAELACAQSDVLLVDSDTQLTSSKWQAVRAENDKLPRVSCVSLFGKSMAKELQNLATRYEHLVVDTGGRDTYEMRAALTVCELAILPFQPSQFDLWTVEKVNEMLETASAVNPNLRVIAVISRAETNHSTQDYMAAQEFISGFPGITLATTPIRSRVAFKRAGQVGMSVIEYERDARSKSTMELRQLYNDIFG